jgi:acetyl-CoA hydrolase
MSHYRDFPVLSAEEAACLIASDATVAFSGFTPAGAAKAVPRALAASAADRRAKGEPIRLRVMTGASTGAAIDDALGNVDGIAWRTPYQSSRVLRDAINSQQTEFLDLHLSHLPPMIDAGFLGEIDVAVVEAVEVERDGRVFLSTSVGASPTFLRHAKQVIVEVNRHHSPRLSQMHDIRLLPPITRRGHIPINHPLDRIGAPFAAVDPVKIVGIVENNEPDHVAAFHADDHASAKIAEHIVRFLADELAKGRIPDGMLPLQSGVGNIANAVMSAIGTSDAIPNFLMYSEVFQDALVPMMKSGRLRGASTTSLTLSDSCMDEVYDDIDFFASRIVLRPQELTNNPGVVRRLGVISINTVLEMDIAGCANSTHVAGTQLMNGIGGSGDFTRNAYLSMLVAPSVAKGGKVSTVVPMVTHVDHNEHSVQVFVTDQGLADLRGLGPRQRAAAIIDKCAHPQYRDYLHRYVANCPAGHIGHDLTRCFELHRNLAETGSMLPEA